MLVSLGSPDLNIIIGGRMHSALSCQGAGIWSGCGESVDCSGDTLGYLTLLCYPGVIPEVVVDLKPRQNWLSTRRA